MRFFLSFVFLGSALVAAGPVAFTTFPTGTLPETIVQAPAGFGSFGGGYFVVDPTTSGATPDVPSNIQYIPSGGGPATVVGTSPDSLRAGVFLPSTFGSYGGDFATVGFLGNGQVGIDGSNLSSTISIYTATGGTLNAPATFASSNTLSFGGLTVAPAGFGSLGGDLLVDYTGVGIGGIAVFTPSGMQLSDLVNSTQFAPYASAFAPAGFGSLGGELFYDSQSSGEIYATNASGQVTDFTNLNLPGSQSMRFIGFAPSAFGQYGGDLVVDVAASSRGATDGMLLFVNTSGSVVGELTGIDPRGFTFVDGGTTMLLDNVDPGILSALPTDVTQVPEPSALALVSAGLALAFVRRRRAVAVRD